MVFLLSALWWIRGLWKLPDVRDWVWGKLGLVLMCRVMLCKSLLQFSVLGLCSLPDVWPEAKLWWKNEDNGDTLRHSVPRPCSRPPSTDTSAGDSWTLTGTSGSISCGVMLLSPGAHKVLFVPSTSLFLQSCVSSGGCMVGLMVTFSKKAYAIPRSAAPRAPAPVEGHCWLIPPQEPLRHSKADLAQSL